MIFLILFTIFLSALSGVPQCQPPNDCSVHIFRVRLSQKPESEEPVENTTYSAVQNNEYGTNYYEIRGGKEMTPKLAAEIIQSMGKDADPRLKEKINNQEFFWKPVSPGGDRFMSASFPPPPPPPPPKKQKVVTTPAPFKPDDFPFLLVTLLLCVGIFVGILLTAICISMANMRKEPQFDRSSVVIYNRVGAGKGRRGEQSIEMIERASVAPSMSSGTRVGPAWRHTAPTTASRHISL